MWTKWCSFQQKGEVLCVALKCVAKWKRNEFAKDLNRLSFRLLSFHHFFNVLSTVQQLLTSHTMILNSHSNSPLSVFAQSHLTIIGFCLLCVTGIDIWSFQALHNHKSEGMIADDFVSTRLTTIGWPFRFHMVQICLFCSTSVSEWCLSSPFPTRSFSVLVQSLFSIDVSIILWCPFWVRFCLTSQVPGGSFSLLNPFQQSMRTLLFRTSQNQEIHQIKGGSDVFLCTTSIVPAWFRKFEDVQGPSLLANDALTMEIFRNLHWVCWCIVKQFLTAESPCCTLCARKLPVIVCLVQWKLKRGLAVHKQEIHFKWHVQTQFGGKNVTCDDTQRALTLLHFHDLHEIGTRCSLAEEVETGEKKNECWEINRNIGRGARLLKKEVKMQWKTATSASRKMDADDDHIFYGQWSQVACMVACMVALTFFAQCVIHVTASPMKCFHKLKMILSMSCIQIWFVVCAKSFVQNSWDSKEMESPLGKCFGHWHATESPSQLNFLWPALSTAAVFSDFSLHQNWC